MARKTKPLHLSVMDGNRGRHRGRGRGLGQRRTRSKPFPPPDHLTGFALRGWQMWEPFLRRNGAIEDQDTSALERLADLYREYRELRGKVQETERVYEVKTRTGDVMLRTHPLVTQLYDVDKRLQSSLAEFGLTPSSRAKLLANRTTVKKPGENDDGDTAAAFLG